MNTIRAIPPEIDNPRFNEFIGDQIIWPVPSILVLFPPRNPGAAQNLLAWRVVGCRWVLDEGLKKMMEIPLDPAENLPFDLRELRRQDIAWYKTDGFSLQTVLEHSRGETLRVLYRLFSGSLFENRLPAYAAFRWIYEEISGRYNEYALTPQPEKVKALSLILRSLDLHNEDFDRGHCLFDEIRHLEPIIFYSKTKQSRFVRITKEKLGISTQSGGKIELSDITGLFLDANPLSEYTDSIITAFKRAAGNLLEPNVPFADHNKDLTFRRRLEKSGKLYGSGEHKLFSIELLPLPPDKIRFRLKLSLGSRPFLMQVCRSCPNCKVSKTQPTCPRSTYILWDLKRYPINVVCESIGTPDGDVLFDSWDRLTFYAECKHKSILRHPFVSNRDKLSTANSYSGSICMEKTASRIHTDIDNNSDSYNPVFILLQLMKGASRILRYGLRKRDEVIPLHNSFVKLRNPSAIYQAVITGAENAEAEAERLNAEKIDYVR